MAVNTSIYGTSESWQNTAFYDKFHRNKKANFGDNTTKLGDGVSKGKLTYNEPIDKSLSYCGLGTESALSHVRYVQNVNNAASIIDSQDRFQTNFLFGEITTQSGTTGDYTTSQLSDFKYQKAWQSNFDNDTWWSSNKNKLVEPYTSIHPKSVVFLIYVIAVNSTFTNSINVTLSEYRTQYTNYPNISQVYIVPFMNIDLATENSPSRTQYGAGGNITTNNRQGFCLGLLDEYKIASRSFSMYSYQLTWLRVVMGNLYGTDTTERNTATSIVYVPENVGEHFKHQRINIYDYYYIRTYIEYYEGIFDEILKTVACFGLYFTEKTNVAQYGLFTDNDMYIGLLDENGIGHGQYLRGANTVNAPQNNYTDMSQSGYDYTKEVDKTKYDNSTNFNLSLSLGAFTKFYQLSESQVNDLCTALYNAVNAQPSGTTIEEYNMKCFLTNNPIDCIISLKKFPLNHFPFVGVPNDIYLGTVDTGIDAPQLLTTTWVYYFDFLNSSDTGLYPVFGGSFLDFEPYTTIQINVPFCGSFEVPTTYFHKYGGVRVALMIDFITGACTAYLMVNNDVVDSISGSCAVDLPVTGLQSATLNGNIHNTAMMKEQQQTSLFSGLIAGAVSIGVGLATGSLPLAVGGGAAIIGSFMKSEDTGKQINYNVEHMQLPLKQVGSASGAIAQCNDYRCKMIIKRPVLMPYDEEVYACTIGYACLLNGKVNNFTGLTIGKIEAETIQNGITDEERAMIESLFASGVIL